MVTPGELKEMFREISMDETEEITLQKFLELFEVKA